MSLVGRVFSFTALRLEEVLKVATCNLHISATLSEITGSINRVMSTNPDVVFFQEMAPGAQALFRKQYGEDYRLVGSPPVAFRRSRFTLKGHKRITLVNRRWVEKFSIYRAYRPASFATRVILRDGMSKTVALLNIHLPTGSCKSGPAGKPGTYRTEYPLIVQYHRDAVKRVRRFVRAQKRLRRDVYVGGDTNYDGLEIPGLVSCWDGRELLPTLNHSTYDMVYHGKSRALNVVRLEIPSDHDAVIATY